MAGSASKECGICNEVFSEISHCPKILPCSHCVCAPCIDHLISKDLKSCPFCRKKFNAATARDLGTNFNLLDILKYVSELEKSTLISQSQKLNEESIANFKRAAKHLSHAMSCNAGLRDASLLADKRLGALLDALKGERADNEELTAHLEEASIGMQSQAKRLAEREDFFRRLGERLQNREKVSPLRSPSMETVKKLNTATKGLMEDMKDLMSDWEKTRLSADKDIERRNTIIDVIEEILNSNK